MSGYFHQTVPDIDENGFYRSAIMSYVQLYIPTEAALAVTAELGELGLIQFVDLNSSKSSFDKLFSAEIIRLDELEEKAKFLIENATLEGVEMRSWGSIMMSDDLHLFSRSKALAEYDEMEKIIVTVEERIRQMNESQRDLTKKYLHFLELFNAIDVLGPYVSSIEMLQSGNQEELDINIENSSDEAIFVSGIIARKKLSAFEKVLWRALRGNVYIRSADFSLDTRGIVTEDLMPESKSAFIAYVHGREVLSRLRNICVALGADLFDIDMDRDRRVRKSSELASKLDDIYAILFNTRQTKRNTLSSVCDILDKFMLMTRKRKLINDAMNKFGYDSDASARKYFIAEGWCPQDSLSTIDSAIKSASERTGLSISPILEVLDSSKLSPPTYFQTNKFTTVFQDMTEAYAIGKYGEANPSLFMLITFPFLFAVMFGDVAHGLFVVIVAGLMIFFEKKLLSARLDEMIQMVFDGRYVIFLMGLFSIYTGFIYNDVASRAMFLFPSSWSYGSDGVATRPNPSYVFPFGLDSAWFISGNAQAFMNSYKMKLAIVIGILQMSLGIFINMHNQIYFGEKIDIICTSLPQFLFLMSIMGYLAFMIVYKWIAGWDASILTMLISMVLKLGAVEGQPIYAGQVYVQTFLVFLAFICIPWMFFAKPLYQIISKRTSEPRDGYIQASENSDSTGTESVSSTTKKAASDEGDMSELWVHQLIHTIEFVLGSVSNTASYLRLWALSLSHSELSDVLWNQTIAKVLTNPIGLFLAFPFWFVFSIFILVVLEGLSSFLHALRLHWVEFNNKFYVGGGTKFEPFTI